MEMWFLRRVTRIRQTAKTTNIEYMRKIHESTTLYATKERNKHYWLVMRERERGEALYTVSRFDLLRSVNNHMKPIIRVDFIVLCFFAYTEDVMPIFKAQVTN